MQGYNLIVVFNVAGDKVLMCKRSKNPYMGLSNFVGGKIEKDENGLDSAYRELYEETSIKKDSISLTHLMSFTYPFDKCSVEVYIGQLKHSVKVMGEENVLYWSGLDYNFFDTNKYAGEGNIGHIFEHIKLHKEKLFNITAIKA